MMIIGTAKAVTIIIITGNVSDETIIIVVFFSPFIIDSPLSNVLSLVGCTEIRVDAD